MADPEKVIKYSTSPEENGNSPNGSILKLEDLPNELILKVLCFLETIDLICCSQLSKRIRAISHDESLWQKMNLYVNGCAFRAKFKHGESQNHLRALEHELKIFKEWGLVVRLILIRKISLIFPDFQIVPFAVGLRQDDPRFKPCHRQKFIINTLHFPFLNYQ